MAEHKENTTKLIVVTPYRDFYESRVNSIVLPIRDGSIGIMAGHTPLVVALKPGIVDARTGEEHMYFTVSEGYSEVSQNMVLIVCNSAEWPSDLKVSRIFKSYADSVDLKNEIMKSPDTPQRREVIKDIEQDMDRSRARYHLISLYGSEKQKLRIKELTEKNGPII